MKGHNLQWSVFLDMFNRHNVILINVYYIMLKYCVKRISLWVWFAQRVIAWILKGCGVRVTPITPSRLSLSPSAAENLNFLNKMTKNRKSSVLASCSPKQALFPVRETEWGDVNVNKLYYYYYWKYLFCSKRLHLFDQNTVKIYIVKYL